jgi:hypothetical protein
VYVGVLSRQRNSKIEEWLKPKTDPAEKSSFVTQVIAEQLKRVVAIGMAEFRVIEAEQIGVKLLGNNPLSRGFWYEQHEEDRRDGPLRREQACVP